MEPIGGPNFEVPAQPPTPETGEQGAERTAEAPPARQERAGKQTPQPVLPVVPSNLPAADQPVIAVPLDDTAAPAASVSVQDGDHIESVWVDKAKDVVARTQDDPYMQKHEMSRVKAEYIQKRFGKQVKTDDPLDVTQGRPELGRKGEAAA